MKGKVSFWKHKKGYGLITGQDLKTYLAHFSEIRTDEEYRFLKSGEMVSFKPLKTEKGYTALDIEVCDES